MSTPAENAPVKRLFAAFGWADAPRLGAADLAAMLWAERVTVVFTGAVVCLLGFALATLAPKTYQARAELLVRMGQEYVYQPTAEGGAGAGAAPDMQEIVNSEMRMMGSGAVARRVIAQVGMRTLYPNIAAAPGSDAQRLAAAERAFASSLALETAPQTPAIALSFKHKDPVVAAAALNALIDQYLAYRRDVLVGGESEALSRQSQELDSRSRQANDALSAFLTENGIGDFDSEMRGLAQRAADVETQSFDADAKRRESEARAGALRSRVNAEPAEIELYSESDARRQLVELQLQREQLLSRYQDNAPPVRELDRRIEQLNTFLTTGDATGLTRRGQNPVRQDMQGQLFAMEAESRAQAGRYAALTQQREEVRERLRTMQALEPQFRQLLRERTILEQNAGNFATRAEQARAFSQMRSTDNISAVERANVPTQGKSLRMPIALITLMLAGIAALAAGLGRGLTRRNFPTPTSAARTLGLPVLAVAPRFTPQRAPKVKAPKPPKAEKTPKAAKRAKASAAPPTPANDAEPMTANRKTAKGAQ